MAGTAVPLDNVEAAQTKLRSLALEARVVSVLSSAAAATDDARAEKASAKLECATNVIRAVGTRRQRLLDKQAALDRRILEEDKKYAAALKDYTATELQRNSARLSAQERSNTSAVLRVLGTALDKHSGALSANSLRIMRNARIDGNIACELTYRHNAALDPHLLTLRFTVLRGPLLLADGTVSTEEFGPFDVIMVVKTARGVLSLMRAYVTAAPQTRSIGGYFHPHVGGDDSLICLGNAHDIALRCLKVGDVLGACAAVAAVLTTYNVASPHKELVAWCINSCDVPHTPAGLPYWEDNSPRCPACSVLLRAAPTPCEHCSACCEKQHVWSLRVSIAKTGISRSGCVPHL